MKHSTIANNLPDSVRSDVLKSSTTNEGEVC